MSDDQQEHEGIFLVDGGQISLSNISFSITDEGEFSSTKPDLKLRYDVCPDWLEIAFENMELNGQAANEIQDALKLSDEEAVGSAVGAD